MAEHLSGERVGKLVRRAGIALALAGAVKAFITLRGGTAKPSESGGWTDLDPEKDQRTYIVKRTSSPTVETSSQSQE